MHMHCITHNNRRCTNACRGKCGRRQNNQPSHPTANPDARHLRMLNEVEMADIDEMPNRFDVMRCNFSVYRIIYNSNM